MAITYNEFGVTIDDVKGRVHSLGINPASSPNTVNVQAMITQAACEIAGLCFSSGIEVADLTSTSAEYGILKNALLNKVVADLMVARQRGGDAPYFLRLYEKAVDIIRKRPQVLGQTENGPNMVASVNRAGNRQNVVYGYTIAGKIVNGGL